MNTKLKHKQTSGKSSSTQGGLPWLLSLPSLPSKPGVYWFLDQKGKILYVGKAKNLKNRVNSYKQVNQTYRKTKKLIHTATKLKIKELDTEIDALVVEAELIKLYQPKYNIRLKDDKSPIYILITDDQYPKIKAVRKNQSLQNALKKNIFGPFDSSYGVKKILSFLRKNIPYCNASDAQIRKQKACFYFHIGQCGGVCHGDISKDEYFVQVEKIRLFLKGKKQRVISQLKTEIKEVSKQMDFESAHQIKQKIEALTMQQNNQVEKDLPILSQDLTIEKLTHLRRILKKFFQLPPQYPLHRIEGYDISNTQGSNATGSMVVFVDGKSAPDQYRMFGIKTKQTPDDQFMMGEVLSRRVKRTEWPIPQLIVIDGGKTQLNAAQKMVSWNIPIVSLVKNPDRLMIKIDKKYYTVPLGKDPASLLLQSIRDESHRFAKNYHKKLRSKFIEIA